MLPPVRASTLQAVMFVLLLGCGGAAESAAGPPMIAQAGSEDQTCSRDSECVLVADCCGGARQGRQHAVHRDRVQPLAEAARAECSAVSCTVADSEHVSCRASHAACRGGRCVPAVD